MSTNMPIVLEGKNLGERQKQFNAIVNSAFEQKIELKSVLETDATSTLDKLYKIDLASKYKDVDYIIENLKDKDMLYVSRALKSRWLLEPEYRDVINPQHLEKEVFPHMFKTAVNKMRHWIHLNLKDSTRCQEFYEYYKDQHQIAIKFFFHCPPDFILTEMLNILHKLTPKDLKFICETCPEAGKVYFEGLHANQLALKRYLENELAYFKSIQCILKLNATLYLDILEKYFNISKFKPLSAEATQYIIKNQKDRFKAKPELYAMHLLNFKTLATILTIEEAKDLVLRLARAEYIGARFSYYHAQALMKRLEPIEKGALTKRVFVDKTVGNVIKDWQYPIPITFELKTSVNNNVFLDKDHHPSEYESCDSADCVKAMKSSTVENAPENKGSCKPSQLEMMFDLYTFKEFDVAFEDIRRKIGNVSNIEGRVNMLFVLVSKSGGVPERVQKLLKLLTAKHINEPCALRGAVVSYLVKRVSVWRLPAYTWNLFLEFGRDLGLKGERAQLVCREGLHAVVLRDLINNVPLSNSVKIAFLNEASTLKEYALNSKERKLVGPRVAKILLDGKPNVFLNVLSDYKLKIDEIPEAEMTLVQKAHTDIDLARRLYDARIGRRYLLKESFIFVKNNESYMNALKHDISVLEKGRSFANLVSQKRPCHDRFLQALVVYFNEPNGLAEQHKTCLIEAMNRRPRPWFARPINNLSTSGTLLVVLMDLEEHDKNDTNIIQLAAAFRATAHKCRPMPNIMSVDCRFTGAKAIANTVFVCPEKDRESNIKMLLKWSRTARIAIRLALDTKYSTETFIRASELRPAMALKIATKTYLKSTYIDPPVWEVIRKLMKKLITEETNENLLEDLKNNKNVPENIKAEYWQVVYEVLVKMNQRNAMPVLCRLENMLPSVDKTFVRSIVNNFLNEEITPEKFAIDDMCRKDRLLHVRVIAKHLLISSSEDEQQEKLENICDVFFDKIQILKDTLKGFHDYMIIHDFVINFVKALKYNKVFLGNYTSCMDVFIRVLERIKKVLPIDQYFLLYVEIHLIMLYYKSVKQSMGLKPNVFENLEQNSDEAIETVGFQFGQNIGCEIKELTTDYYFSVIDIYKSVLDAYLDGFNESTRNKNNAMVVPVLKGLLVNKQTESILLAHFVMKNRRLSVPESYSKEIMKCIREFNNEIVNFFMHANL